MNPIVRNILAVIAGVFLGMVANMAIFMLFMIFIPLPEGVDMNNLGEKIHLLEMKHFIGPFLAHAMHALLGAFVAAKLAVSRNMQLALLVGVIVLLSGIANVIMINAPGWFTIADLALAYLPMAWLGGKLAGAKMKG